jgi:hypothetical protein
MRPRPGPHQPLSQSLSAARQAAERAAVICATAAEACARAERIVAESKAARETRALAPILGRHAETDTLPRAGFMLPENATAAWASHAAV